MYRVQKKNKNAARRMVYSFGSAVLFFLCSALLESLYCPSVLAVGLQISLEEKDRKLVNFGELNPTVGLSIYSDSIPLLKNTLTCSRTVQVDYEHQYVCINQKVGNYKLQEPLFLTLPAYTLAANELQNNLQWRNNLSSHFMTSAGQSKSLFQWEIPVKFPKMVSRIIGEGGPGLKVSGYRRISFSGRSTWEEGLVNTATSRQSKFPSLNMEQQSAFSITGTIGSKISVKVDQNSQRTSDLANTLQLRYQGDEDEIIQTVEAGNTNLSVGSGTVGYGETKQGLFGLKTTAKIAGWNLTMITSQDKGSTEKAEFKAGAETKADVIRDYEYLERTFYDLGYTGDFSPGDSIVELRLFKSNTTINSNTAQNPAPFGIAYVNPRDTLTAYPEGTFERRFQEIDAEDYFVQREQYWIQFFRTPEKNDILATYYIVRHADHVTYDTVGFVKDSCSSAEGDICMHLKLLKPDTPKPTDYTWEYEWKNVYFLNSKYIDRDGFQLDIYKGTPSAEDIKVDKNYQDSTLYLRVFGLDQLDLNAASNPDGIVDYRQIDFGLGYLIFPNRHPFAPIPSSKYYTNNPADSLKERVESIYSSNQLQDKVEDSKYYIYVQSASRKTQYSLGHAPIIEGSDVVTLNGTVLKRDQDYTIVYETGDITFLNPDALSPTANLSVDYDYAPLLSAEKKSMFGMMAEYSVGNNFKFGTVGIYKSEKTSEDRPRVGQEPIRNFIWGSNLTFNASPAFLTRMLNVIPWVKTDAPSRLDFRGDVAQSIPNPNTINQAFIDDFEGSLEYTDLSIRRGVWTLASPPLGKTPAQRCKMWWYNPYDQVLIQDIWPNKEVERNAERTNVMELKFFPQDPQQPSDTLYDTVQVENRYNGIMRPLYLGAYDQTRTKFLEVWVSGNRGILHVDLGQISEDLNGDKILNTEDKPRNGQRDGILADDEDLGLDTLTDEQEREVFHSTLPDPSGDNWSYNNHYDYSHINGTQGNRDDPDRGRRPDTEDINSNSTLDLTNSYFEFDIDLSQTKFLGDLTNTTGWRLYRIPLKDPSNYRTVGSPDWTDIRFARIWVSHSDSTTIDIASIQLVGNRWQNQGISSITTRQTPLPLGTNPEEEFEVYVINTHENPGYQPPPKVAGTLNRQTGVREKEQSLVLNYHQLKPYHQGSAYRILLYQPEDYTSYRYLKMFVHGPDNPENVRFFLKLGADSSNYYEYHTTLYPGWDERNDVTIDFDQITALKAYARNNRPSNSVAPIDTTVGPYRVRGNPTLTQVRWFSMGVVNIDTVYFQPVSGDVWVDEMRVTDVRKEKGVAGSMSLITTLADVGNLSFSYKQQDSQYRSLAVSKGSGINHSDYQFNLSSFQVHRFLPVSIGYMLPLSFSYTHNLDLPKWESGSDIILPKELREKEKSESVTKSIGFAPAFNYPTQNWLLGLTLKRMTHSITYSTNRSTSLSMPVSNGYSTTFNGGYTFPFGKRREFKPFGWLKGSLFPQSFTQMGFSLLPDNIGTSGSFNESRSHSENNVGTITDLHYKTFNGNLTAGASFIKSIPLTYTMSTSRNLIDPITVKYSLNPKDAKLGVETRYTETFSAKYAPAWLAFLNANFSFNSGYNENSDPTDSRNAGNARNITNDNSRVAGITLDWVKLLGAAKKGEKRSILNPFNLLRILTRRIDPVNVSYRRNQSFAKSGLLGRPSWSYRLGFIDNPQVGSAGLAQSTDQVQIADAYSAKSGIALLATHISANYSKNVNRTIATEATKNISTRFPDLGFSFNRLGNFKLLKKFFTAVSYNFGYFKQVEESGNERTGETYSRSTSQSFSPLASFSLDWKKGIRSSIRYTRDTKKIENLRIVGGNQSVSIDYNNAITINNSYSFSAPHGIKLPFLRKIKFNSNLTLSLNLTQNSKKTKSSVGGNPFNITADNNRFALSTSAGYSFSSQVTGGMSINWADTNDKITKRKTHTREVGLFMQISF
jgi:hypothetical protein